ncbi:MAG: DUF4139 domain-containing protein [Novosphingobium sp.]
MRRWLILFLALIIALPAQAQMREVAAADPSDISVTIYRAPYRNGGSIRLDSLGGFAVVMETRNVRIPAGKSRLRFEGVVDGILPESAIVSGLPGGVIEKNRDAALLNPSSLMRAMRGKAVTLRRTDPRTGKAVAIAAEMVSAGPDGVVFKTVAGIENLRCTGLPETFRYSSGAEGLSARPTLSVMTSSPREITATVTLTYIAEGFDWSANYTAHINPNGKTMDIGGWITLANGNGMSLPNARTQIVAGGLNRAYVQKFVNNEPQVVAKCWPSQRTHQVPRKPERPYQLVQPYMGEDYDQFAESDSIVVTAQRRKGGYALAAPPPAPVMAMAPPPPPPPPEQLGDLKLYRVPQRTTVAGMQMKQTRLVEQQGVPFERIHTAMISVVNYGSGEERPQTLVILRTRNDKEHQLGLPLPSGAFVIEQDHWGRTMRIAEPSLRDTAEDEKIELGAGYSPDVTVVRRTLRREGQESEVEVEVSNASPQAIVFELKVAVYGSWKIGSSDAKWEKRDGVPVFVLRIPAEGSVKLRYSATSN